MKEEYLDYTLTSRSELSSGGKYSVGVQISRTVEGKKRSSVFHAQDGILYILEVEARKEGINLGKNLIDRGLVGF